MANLRTVTQAVAVALFLAPGLAMADMGLEPAGPKQTYGSIEGGYLFQDGRDIIGYGIAVAPGNVSDVLVNPGSGWFAGGMAGYENGTALISGLPFTRIELYLLFGRTSDSASDALAGQIQLENTESTFNVSGGDAGSTDSERQTWEGGLRFEFDDRVDARTTFTWVFSPFIRNIDESTSTIVTGCCALHRNGDADAWMYGATLSVEPEYVLWSGVSLVTRVGVGIYGYDADTTFHSFSTGLPPPDPFLSGSSSHDSGIGFRGLLGAGLKFRLGDGANLETFAEADYFSDVGTAVFSDNNDAHIDPSHIGSDSLWELRAGARLTIRLGQ
jgi:hypothetical protein